MLQVYSDVNAVASTLINLKTLFPGANIGKMVAKAPKMLLQDPTELQEDAKKVIARCQSVNAG